MAVIGVGAVIVIALAYLRVECLTKLYASQFDVLTQSMHKDRAIVYYKVFLYSPPRAKLFVVDSDSQGRKLGFYANLESVSGQWKVTNYELVWATYGSADNWTWPPYW